MHIGRRGKCSLMYSLPGACVSLCSFSFTFHFASKSHKRTSWQSPRAPSRESLYKNKCEPLCVFLSFFPCHLCMLLSGQRWHVSLQSSLCLSSTEITATASWLKSNEMEWAFGWNGTADWLRTKAPRPWHGARLFNRGWRHGRHIISWHSSRDPLHKMREHFW